MSTTRPLPVTTARDRRAVVNDGFGPRTAVVRNGRSLVRVAWAAESHVGHVRTLNEDALLAAPPVFVVADGMGGHDHGEVASALAIGSMSALHDRERLDRAAIVDAVQSANHVIHQRSSGGSRGMGTTITGVVVASVAPGHDLVAVNVGDSRTYLLRGGRLTQVTVDHSHVQELIDAGKIDPAEASTHPERNVVTRALGIDPDVDVDVIAIAAAAGDRFLVCSDGVSGEVDDDQIVESLSDSDPGAAAVALLACVLHGAARDNATLIVVDVLEITEDPDQERTNPRQSRASANLSASAELPTDPRGRAAATTQPTPIRAATPAAPRTANMPANDSDAMIDVVPNRRTVPVIDELEAPEASPPGLIHGVPAMTSAEPITVAFFEMADDQAEPAAETNAAANIGKPDENDETPPAAAAENDAAETDEIHAIHDTEEPT